ncbi:MAG TPA: translation initiation factor IF-2 [Lacunisphaera sp.]
MSSTETSGAPAEAPATHPAPEAAFPTFGTTRGSGLARGKRPSTGPAATTAAAPSDYKPTAIEVVNAPREYTNPFAPAETPAPEAAPAPAAVAPVVNTPAPAAVTPAPVQPAAVAPAPVQEEPAELNILPPAEQKTAPAQTWESEGFRPARAERSERPRREERPRSEERADEPVDIASIPEKFLYVRPGVTFVPTPRNWGGAPRERRSSDENAPRSVEAPRASAPASAAAPEKSGGFLGWLKGLFGGSSASAEPITAGAPSASEHRREGGEHRRHRGGRNRGGPGGERRGGRGGRGRSGGGGYPPREGSSQGGV